MGTRYLVDTSGYSRYLDNRLPEQSIQHKLTLLSCNDSDFLKVPWLKYQSLNITQTPLMFTQTDLAQMASQGISQAEVEQQIQHFRQGFPFMYLSKAATVSDGILRLNDTALAAAIAYFDTASASAQLLKFVPASGAATRMFKSLFGFLEAGKKDKSVEQFFEQLGHFAFAQELQDCLPENANEHTTAEYFLTDKGLDYGALPKGLLTFHRYETATRTSVEEHLVEGATYASTGGRVRLHFTVSPEHRPKFKALIDKVLPIYEKQYGVTFDIAFSEQKPATDTIAVNLDNTPFREKDGSLLFRPAGHGALLSNLNDIEADVVFIKNIDNVVPDAIKSTTIQYKKALAGVLLQYQQRLFNYQSQLNSGNVSGALLSELSAFFATEMCVLPPDGFGGYSDEQKVAYFSEKLNRPLRICGMVPNVGEPGGGPFWCQNSDGTTSLQVVESAQVDMDNADQKAVFMNATHFNPVDLICSLKDYQGHKFDLMAFRDPQTGFITQKSKDGKDLKAQELPGLWNGSMANWNTLFVEVPLITFNPVKTVNDLLRAEHQ